MAARVQPQAVRSTHHSTHHLMVDAPSSDTALMAAVAQRVLSALVKPDEPVCWIVDGTGFLTKGKHSAGVAH